MVVYLFWEQDNAKDEEKRQRYRKWVIEEWQPYAEKYKDIVKATGFTDGTGKMYGLWEFADMDALGKVWNDEEFQRLTIRRNELVDKLSVKLCRPGLIIPPKK